MSHSYVFNDKHYELRAFFHRNKWHTRLGYRQTRVS